MILKTNDHVLFYGDSITDCGRKREDLNSLGGGFVHLIGSRLLALYPEWNLRVTNKGISGNRIYDLESRLEEDVLALKPTVVSFLIGINDTWRFYDSKVESPRKEFQDCYRRIITRLQKELPDFRGVICEPFLLPIPEDRRKWREDLDPRIMACREIAWEFGFPYLPLDGLFAAEAVKTGPAYWMGDGVHPSVAGHGLIAEKWLETVMA